MVNFTLKQLRYVEAAGRLGSIASAAQELAISQSSITAAIDSVEQELGHDLFVRAPAKGVRTTPAGHDALLMIRGFLDQARHFESELKSIGGDTTGSVRIACYATAAPSVLPPILKSFAEKYPRVSVTLLEGDMETIMQFLLDGEADIAFNYSDLVDKRFHFAPLFDAPPFVLVSEEDSLAQQKSVSLKQIGDRPMVMLDLPLTRAYFTKMFEDQGLRPNVVHSSRSTEIVRALVSGGFGFSILNIFPPAERNAAGGYAAIPIADNVRAPNFGIVTQSSARQPKMIDAFIDHCMGLKRSGIFDPMVVR